MLALIHLSLIASIVECTQRQPVLEEAMTTRVTITYHCFSRFLFTEINVQFWPSTLSLVQKWQRYWHQWRKLCLHIPWYSLLRPLAQTCLVSTGDVWLPSAVLWYNFLTCWPHLLMTTCPHATHPLPLPSPGTRSVLHVVRSWFPKGHWDQIQTLIHSSLR